MAARAETSRTARSSTARRLRGLARRRQIFTVFYLSSPCIFGSLYTPDRTVHPMRPETDASVPAQGDLPEAAIRAQLQRILASDVFSRA